VVGVFGWDHSMEGGLIILNSIFTNYIEATALLSTEGLMNCRMVVLVDYKYCHRFACN